MTNRKLLVLLRYPLYWMEGIKNAICLSLSRKKNSCQDRLLKVNIYWARSKKENLMEGIIGLLPNAKWRRCSQMVS